MASTKEVWKLEKDSKDGCTLQQFLRNFANCRRELAGYNSYGGNLLCQNLTHKQFPVQAWTKDKQRNTVHYTTLNAPRRSTSLVPSLKRGFIKGEQDSDHNHLKRISSECRATAAETENWQETTAKKAKNFQNKNSIVHMRIKDKWREYFIQRWMPTTINESSTNKNIGLKKKEQSSNHI